MAFYSCQHATRIVILYVPILPLVRFWQHSIHKISIQQTVSELGGPGDNIIPQQTVVYQNLRDFAHGL